MKQITGDPWEVYVQKNIFAPLGMTHSYFGVTPYYLESDRTHNYTLVKDADGKETLRDTAQSSIRELPPTATGTRRWEIWR